MRRRRTTENFIEHAIKIHRAKYNYDKVNYLTSHVKINIICPIHGEFEQSPNEHLKGKGCAKCGGNLKSSTEDFIEKSIRIHGNLYNYSLVNYKNNHVKVIIICNIHGEFKQIPNGHLLGYGCPSCGGTAKSNSKEFIKKAIKIHDDLYDYSLVNYKNNRYKIKIICKTHGEFSQTPHNHLQGHGCSKCLSSNGEFEIIEFLNKNQILYICQKTFSDCKNPKTNRKLKFDFYILVKNLLIEFDGIQHFQITNYGSHIGTQNELQATQYRDSLKNEYAIKNSIKLLRIKYTEFDKIDEILTKELGLK